MAAAVRAAAAGTRVVYLDTSNAVTRRRLMQLHAALPQVARATCFIAKQRQEQGLADRTARCSREQTALLSSLVSAEVNKWRIAMSCYTGFDFPYKAQRGVSAYVLLCTVQAPLQSEAMYHWRVAYAQFGTPRNSVQNFSFLCGRVRRSAKCCGASSCTGCMTCMRRALRWMPSRRAGT